MRRTKSCWKIWEKFNQRQCIKLWNATWDFKTNTCKNTVADNNVAAGNDG